MSNDSDKTKEQLLAELKELRKKSKEQEDKLKAENQQLQATEQQLRAVNQQLNASNQKLQAIEQQLRAANQELTESEAKYKNLSLLKKAILESPEGIIVFALDKNYCYLDFTLLHKQTMKAIWDVDIEIGNNMLDYIKFKPDREKAKENFDRALKGEQFVLYEEYGDENLKRTFYENRYSPVYDEKNNIIGLSVYVIDVTERKLAEEKLKESEEKYRTIFESAKDAIFIMQDDRFIDCNEKTLEMFGCDREDIIGESPYEFSPEKQPDGISSLEKAVEKINKVLEGEPQVFEWVHTTKDGALFYTIVTLNRYMINDERFLMAIVHDITERKRAEESLRNSEETFKGIFNNTTDAIYVQDENGAFLDVNQGAVNMYGYTREELIGNTPELVSAPGKNDLKMVKECIQKAYNGEPQQFEFWGKRKNGEVFPKIVRLSAGNYFGKKIILAFATDITERKQAEMKLQESEKKNRELATLLRLMADNMPDMLWAKNLNKKFIFANKALCTNLLNAKDTDEPLGKTDMFFAMRERNAHPDNPEWHTFGEACVDSDAATLEAMKPMHFDEFGNVKGKFLFLDVHKAPLYDSDGQLIGTVGSARDVTTAKEAEKQLRKLSTAVKQSSAVIAITDTEGKLEYVNPKFTELTGYSMEEVIGQNPRILKSGKQSYEMYKELWQTITSGNVWRGEFHNKKKNGKLFWEMASISPIFDEQGKIINYIKVAEDITQLKRNEEIRSIIHNISNAAITSHSPEDFLTLVKEELGKVIDTTNFFVATYDEKTDTISLPLHHDEKDKFGTFPAGKTLTNYVIKTGKSLLAKKSMIEKLIKSGEVELVGHLSEVWLGIPLKSHNKITGIFAVQSYDNENAYDEADVKILEIISHQISLSLERLKAEEELKLAKEKAEESDRLKSAFLANMSHEIRTPMNGILGFTSLLLNPDYSGEEKEEFIKMIHKSGQRMLDTVTEIVEISKIEAGIITTEWQEIDLNSILEEQIMFFGLEAQKKGLELVLDGQLPEDKSSIITDKHKFEAILINLIKNAIKYTDKGRINVGAKLKNDFVEFYVQDTGIGVPKNRRKAIFNRFEQADIGDSRAFEGSGLGLAISKSYVEMLGGEIWLESEENKGSVFYFTLPVKKAKKVKPVAISKELTASNDNNTELPDIKLKVLVAEDDNESFVYLTMVLKKYNWNIIRTKTGRQTIEKFKEQPDIDLILMDIKLSDLDGYEATRQIKAINPEVPIIAQTAYALEGDRQKALDAGCDEYISKPINKEMLIEKIRACLDKKGI